MIDTKERFKDGEGLPDPIDAREDVIRAAIGTATVALGDVPEVFQQPLAPIIGMDVQDILAARRATQLGVVTQAVAEVDVQPPSEMTTDEYLDHLAGPDSETESATVPETSPSAFSSEARTAIMDSAVDVSFNQQNAV